MLDVSKFVSSKDFLEGRKEAPKGKMGYVKSIKSFIRGYSHN
jgi:hypothetical protein